MSFYTFFPSNQAEFGKSYPEPEDAIRYKIFEENLLVVDQHNKKYANGEVAYSKGLNQFSDWIPFTWAEAKTSSTPKQTK